MNTLSIISTKQGITFDADAAVQGFAIVEKLASVTGALLKAVRGFSLGGSLRPAQA